MILSAGLSPAWQQILTFDRLSLGGVNRAQSAQWCASGKVLNVGRAVAGLGGNGHTLCTVGGPHGERIRDEFAAAGITATWIATSSATRVCTTLIDRSEHPPMVTELVESASPATLNELTVFEQTCRELLSDARIAVFTGSLPDVVDEGPPVDVWASLVPHVPIAILDVRGPELIASLSSRPQLVKPNRAELEATVGQPLSTESELVAAMRELNKAGAEWVLTTDGSRPAYLTSREEVWRFIPPTRDVVNPIGCGDCLTAGIAVFLDSNEVIETAGSRHVPDMVLAVRFGMAASVVNLADVKPARLTLEAAERNVQDVTFDKLTWID